MLGQLAQLGAGLPKLGQSLVDFGQALFDELADVLAGRVVPVRDVLDLPLFAHVRDSWRPQILANAT